MLSKIVSGLFCYSIILFEIILHSAYSKLNLFIVNPRYTVLTILQRSESHSKESFSSFIDCTGFRVCALGSSGHSTRGPLLYPPFSLARYRFYDHLDRATSDSALYIRWNLRTSQFFFSFLAHL